MKRWFTETTNRGVFVEGYVSALRDLAETKLIPAEAIPFIVLYERVDDKRIQELLIHIYSAELPAISEMFNPLQANLSKLTNMTKKELLDYHMVGKQTLKKLQECLVEFGLSLKD